jgi:putative Mg2+ transporter-C (MgtC) family protein
LAPTPSLLDVFVRIAVAGLLGLALGVEREFHQKPAGLRTNALISIGSALFTVISLVVPGGPEDQARIAAQIVTGVGFLGAGAIMHRDGGVLGLTTAAVVWTNAAVGMAAGAGQLALAAGVTAIAIAVLVLALPLEVFFERRFKNRPQA